MPVELAFTDSDVSQYWSDFDLIIDFSFMLDWLINCISAFYDEDGNLVYNNKQIMIHYLKGWFMIDAVASFPFNLIEENLDL